MPLTGRLGTSDSRLGQFHLGDAGSGGSGPTVVTNTLALSQSVTVGKTLNISVSQTLSMTSTGLHIAPLTPVIGYSGGQTRYAFVIDITNNVPLYELSQDTLYYYMASTTKMMTAYLLMQYKSSVLDTEYVTFISADVTVPYSGASSAGFMAGDVCNWRDVLYGLFLPSAFESCQIIGRIIGHLIYTNAGSTGLDGLPRFIQAMNSMATTLGMTNTTYVECSGLSKIGGTNGNISTARDIATICTNVFGYSDIQSIANTPTHNATITGPNARSLAMTNYNRFINGPTLNQSGISDPNVIGGKNGTWSDAGDHFNLAQLWNSPNGTKVVIVTCNSESILALTYDQQGLIYQLCQDFPYLRTGVDDGTDAAFNNVKLLMGFDSSTVADEIVPTRSFTNSGVAFDGGVVADSAHSLKLAAQSDYARVTNNDSDLLVHTTDSTMELWFRGNGTVPTESCFFGKADHTGTPRREWLLDDYTGLFQIFVSTDGTNWTSQIVFSLSTAERAVFYNGAPRHVALTQKSGVWNLWINGETGTNTITGSPVNTTVPVSIGYWAGTVNISAEGDFDDFRITVGTARYTANKEYLRGFKFPRSGTLTQSAHQTMSLSQTVGLGKTLNLSVSQTLSLTQQAAHPIDKSVSQSITLSQTVSFLNVINKSANNALALTQTVVVSTTLGEAVYQTLIPTHHNALGKTLNLSVVQNPGLMQTPTGIDTKLCTSTLVFSQSAVGVESHGAHNALEITQVVRVSTTLNLRVYSDFIPFQRYDPPGAMHVLQPTQTVALVQVVNVQHVKFVNNYLTLGQSATAVNCKPGINVLNFIQLATLTKTLGEQAGSPLGLFQSVFLQKSRARSVAHAFGMNQTVRATKVLTAFAGNILHLSQQLWRDLHVETTPQTLALTSTVVGQKIATPVVNQALALSQTVGLSTTLVRSVTQTLVFQPTFQKYIGVTNNPYVSVPTVQGIVVNKIRNTILEGNGLAIVLPSPEFNDKEAPPLKVNIKRSMNGVRRAYVRTVPTAQLTYDFIMDRLKAIELRQFILANDASLIRMTNFKGEVWMVQITNNPVTFTEVALWQSPWGNKSSCTLEFEGMRIT